MVLEWWLLEVWQLVALAQHGCRQCFVQAKCVEQFTGHESVGSIKMKFIFGSLIYELVDSVDSVDSVGASQRVAAGLS